VKVAALYPGVESIVRVTADCPLLDPAVIEQVIQLHMGLGLAFLPDYTGLAAAWGDGVADCEVFDRDALLTADAEATKVHHREHVGPYIWEQPEHFRLAHLPCPFDLSHLRPSVDTQDDLLYVQMILERCLARYGFSFGWREAWWTIEQDATLLEYMVKRPMNQAYLDQVGSGKDWQEERYGAAQAAH
jgi:spore coat polysaccharide biosynthesis protein SpsF (cytidylyltransferase family)